VCIVSPPTRNIAVGSVPVFRGGCCVHVSLPRYSPPRVSPASHPLAMPLATESASQHFWAQLPRNQLWPVSVQIPGSLPLASWESVEKGGEEAYLEVSSPRKLRNTKQTAVVTVPNSNITTYHPETGQNTVLISLLCLTTSRISASLNVQLHSSSLLLTSSLSQEDYLRSVIA
jgi:hypothetical protein